MVAVMIARDIEPRLKSLAKQFPAIVLTGPRQSGKSTVCQKVFAHLPYATLESPDVRALASEDLDYLTRLSGGRRAGRFF